MSALKVGFGKKKPAHIPGYSTPKEALILLNTHHDDGSTSGEKLAAGVIMRHGQIWQRAIEDHRWFLLDLLYLHTTAPTVAA
jgi:hypothetical protein